MASVPSSPERGGSGAAQPDAIPAGLHASIGSVEEVREACAAFRGVADSLRTAIARTVIGQHDAVEQVLMALFANGHVLLEGVPGLGKTLLVKALGASLGLGFARIQCTPDLMPADVLGTHIVVDDEAGGGRSMRFRPGPIFAQILLVDEINPGHAEPNRAGGHVPAARGAARPLPAEGDGALRLARGAGRDP